MGYRRIRTVLKGITRGKFICRSKIFVLIRIDKPPDGGIIIPALQVIIARLFIVIIAAVRARVDRRKGSAAGNGRPTPGVNYYRPSVNLIIYQMHCTVNIIVYTAQKRALLPL